MKGAVYWREFLGDMTCGYNAPPMVTRTLPNDVYCAPDVPAEPRTFETCNWRTSNDDEGGAGPEPELLRQG